MAKKLVFNSTDADTLAASDFVGAHLYAGGSLIGKLDGSADAVATGFNAADVAAFGYLFNGTTWDRLRGTSGAVHINDGGNSITVDATQLDIDDLNATDDAVQAWAFDGTGNAIGSTGGALNVNISSGSVTVSDAALANTALAAANSAQADVEALIVASPLANRKYLYLYNYGSHEDYLGPTGVTTGTGFPIYPGVYLDFRAGAAIAMYGITKATKTTDIRSLELS